MLQKFQGNHPTKQLLTAFKNRSLLVASERRMDGWTVRVLRYFELLLEWRHPAT